ncbi:glycosyltransferase family 2 protein [Laspinema sp. A4]|uniref:glycosyltransferase family 2 protein n=1 Tax=Laspinema sp. D2d TaxID=2953686 RepID=UPI0021BA516F|nr:glycosyltransferase family 2 protein [Laspinema sp. D2d]MCT7984809.1 glycosyltransferase family 2 protein [Laspinema sp. D2d]
MPIISVIVPAYNAEKTIVETLHSVQNQTFSDWEVLMIDDGSSDRTLQIVTELKDPRIQVFSYPNAGVAVARNHGIMKATGDYIAFLDADDLWTPDKLELQLRVLQDNPEAGVAYSWNYYQYENPADSYADTSPRFQGNVYPDLLIKNFLQNGSNPLVRKEAIASVGFFDPTIKSCEDWDYYLRLARNWPFVLVPKVQVIYRQSSDSVSSNIEVMEDYLLRLINRTFQSVPQELKHLKNQSISWVYKYVAHHYFIKKNITSTQVQLAAKNLMKAVLFYPPHCWDNYTQYMAKGILDHFIEKLQNRMGFLKPAKF